MKNHLNKHNKKKKNLATCLKVRLKTNMALVLIPRSPTKNHH